MLGLPPRPRNITLSREQKKERDNINWVLFDFAQELFQAPPDQAVILAEQVQNRVGIPRNYMVSSMPEEPWFPGALASFEITELQKHEDLIVLNPQALTGAFQYGWKTVVVVPAQIDRMVTVGKRENSLLVNIVPMQNLAVFILPFDDYNEIPNTREIYFSEDYQYVMVSPEIIREFYPPATAPSEESSSTNLITAILRWLARRR